MASAHPSWPPFTLHVQPATGSANNTRDVEKNGRNAPRYSPNPAASAARPPLMMMRKEAQPKRKPHSGP